MDARRVDDAAARLRELRRESWELAAAAALAFSLALAASSILPELAIPLMLGGLVTVLRLIGTIWRRWDLLDRLVPDPDAYAIPEVRARATRAATTDRRHELACSIWTLLESPALDPGDRAADAARELAALACELDAPRLALDTACAVACERLLTDAAASPLLNRDLPREDLDSWIRRIRAGFALSSREGYAVIPRR
jgi:hypothetical protein